MSQPGSCCRPCYLRESLSPTFQNHQFHRNHNRQDCHCCDDWGRVHGGGDDNCQDHHDHHCRGTSLGGGGNRIGDCGGNCGRDDELRRWQPSCHCLRCHSRSLTRSNDNDDNNNDTSWGNGCHFDCDEDCCNCPDPRCQRIEEEANLTPLLAFLLVLPCLL